MCRAECMPESKVLNVNELETVCDTAIKLFINSVTEQLATETWIGMQLIDFFSRAMSFEGPVINGDSNWDQLSFTPELLHLWDHYVDFTSKMFPKNRCCFRSKSRTCDFLLLFHLLSGKCTWSRNVLTFGKQLKRKLSSAGKQKRAAVHPFSVATRGWKKGGGPEAPPYLPPSHSEADVTIPLESFLKQVLKSSGRLRSAQLLPQRQTRCKHGRSLLRAWSVSTTGLRATWRDSWSTRMTWRQPTVPGWTRASVTPLRPSPGWWAPSTAPTRSSRTPWTACTKWSRSDPYQRQRHPRALTKAWRRSGEDAVHWSKVRNSRRLNLKRRRVSMARLWLDDMRLEQIR